MGSRRRSPDAIQGLAADVLRDGFCILPGQFSAETLATWSERFAPLLDAHIEREGHLQNRGTGRWYVTLPFIDHWADPVIFEDDDVLAIVEALVGADPVFCQLATDTPGVGSDYQATHRDAPPLFPETGEETPPFQLAVNFPLVEVTHENGPLEIARGTHMMPKGDALAAIASGHIPLEPIPMKLGDVMVRDVRALHRGTPNRTPVPRPMVVLGYSRKWLHRPEVHIRVPRDVRDGLSDRAKHLLRFSPVVGPGEAVAPETEVYQAFAY